MKRALNILIRTIAGIVVGVILLPITLMILLQIDSIQNFVVGKATTMLSEMAGTRISIERVDLSFFNSAELEGVLIEDRRGDTMIYAHHISMAINGINFITGKISVGNVTLNQSQVNLYKDSLGVMNITDVFDRFKPKTPNLDPPNFRLTATELNLLDTRFTMSEFNAPADGVGINYKNMRFEKIDFQAREISVNNYNIWLRLEHLSFVEQCGLNVEHLSSERCGVDSSGMYYAHVRLESGRTILSFDSLNFQTKNRSWFDWNDFTHQMVLGIRLAPSTLDLHTLGYAANLSIPSEQVSWSGGQVNGAVDALQGQLRGIDFLGNTASVRFAITGLPDVEQTLFEGQIEHLSSSGGQTAQAVSHFSGAPLGQATKELLERIGAFNATAEVKGLLSDLHFKARLNAVSGGTVALDGRLHELAGRVSDRLLSANVSVGTLDVGQIVAVKKLGEVSLKGHVNVVLGKGRFNLASKGEISALDYGTYRFSEITWDGLFSPSGFRGTVASTDPNMDFTATGAIDLSGKAPDYEFDMDLRRADLALTGVNKRDSVSLLSAHLSAKATGANLDQINGYGSIDKILYINHSDTVRTDKIFLESQNTAALKQIKMFSSFADVSLRGRNSFSQIWRYISQSIERLMPTFPEVSEIVTRTRKQSYKAAPKRSEVPFAEGYYQLSVDVKQANNVAAIFVPGLEVSEGSKLNFMFNPYLDQFRLRASSDKLSTLTWQANSLSVDGGNYADSLALFVTADQFQVGTMRLPDLSVIGGVRNGVISLGARFSDTINHTSALVHTTSTLVRSAAGLPQLRTELHATPLRIEGAQWNLSRALFLMDTTGIAIHGFSLSHNDQRLAVDGRAGRTEADTLSLSLRRFDLSPASVLIADLGYRLAGRADGEIHLLSTLHAPRLFAAVDFDSLRLNNHSLGSPRLRSTLDRQTGRINFAVGENLLEPPIRGYFAVKEQEWGGQIRFPNFDMSILEPLLAGILTQTHGQADVQLALRGKGALPNLSGTVAVKSYSAMVDYTRTRYNLSGTVEVKDNNFTLAPTPFTDGGKGHGVLRAKLTSHYFKNLKYDIEASFTDLLALNTTIKENTSFYGHAFGTGRVSVVGDERHTNINVVAKTAGNSTFVLPLSSASTIESADFIRFVDPDAPSATVRSVRGRAPRAVGANELDIRIDLEVLPNTLAQIEFDAKIGDVIKARGVGNLSMHINPTQNIFTMNGGAEITQGDYLFTLMTIFQRRFSVNPGATISWTGDPTNPQMDLGASYRVKTSLEPLMGSQTNVSSSANIDCSILLSGKLMTPNIRFAITAPSADPEIQNLLRNLLNTEEAMSMQFLSLLLSNSFMPDMGNAAIGTMGGSFVGVTGVEFLANQLSQLISSEKVNIRLGYRPQTTLESDQISAGVGADLIADVLSVEVDGNYRTGPQASSRAPFTIDAYLTWNINKSRTLKLKGFTRTIDRFDETQGLQESGVGIYFRQEFSDWVDLKRRLLEVYGPKSKQQKEDRKRR